MTANISENNDFVLDEVDFIIKVSERCNIACTYCYFFFSGDKSYLEHPAFISPTTVDSAVDFIYDAVVSYGIKFANVSLHGGEPLLLKKGRFGAICDQLRQKLDAVCSLKIATQTNGILIDDEWIDIFSKYQVEVGVSLDGPMEIHDRARLDHKGRGTYEKVAAGIRKLQAAVAANRILPFGCLTVIDPEGDGRVIYRHLVDELNIKGINFVLPDQTHDNTTSDQVDGLRDYLLAAFDEWTTDNRREIRLRFFSTIVGFLVSRRLDKQKFVEEILNQKRVITIASNGDLGPNDYLKPLDTRFQNTGLNTRTHKMSDLIAHEVWRELDEAARRTPAICDSCRWFNLCRGGDIAHRFSASDRFKKETIYCRALKKIYPAVESYLVDHGIAQEELDKRLARDAGAALVAQETSAAL